jgi:hypothetical protein
MSPAPHDATERSVYVPDAQAGEQVFDKLWQ